MKKELCYRITRIFLVVAFLLFASSVRAVSEENFLETGEIDSGMSAGLQLVSLNKDKSNIKGVPVSDEEGSRIEGYKFKITNNYSFDKTFTFVLIDNNVNEFEKLPYKYVRYQIVKDGVVVVTDNISDSGYLYEETLSGNGNSIYEIKFWIDIDAGEEISGKRFSSKIALI